jgi:hypothetical protein
MCGIKFQETFGNNVGVSDLSKKIIREKSIIFKKDKDLRS